MVSAMTWVEDVRPWEDDGPNSWQAALSDALQHSKCAVLGTEGAKTAGPVAAHLAEAFGALTQRPVTGILSAMRVIKTPAELEIMRQAGQVAIAMVEAAKGALGEGVPEYEVALAVIAGGSRKAAEFLTDRGWEAFVSPIIHNLQIMQSGHDTAMVHRRSNVRRLSLGDPVYFCFCNMANFKQYKLGFDRQFFIGQAGDDAARDYEHTISAQLAALGAIRAGAVAEEVHFAAAEVYQAAGYGPGYRTGRSIGISYLEAPELKIRRQDGAARRHDLRGRRRHHGRGEIRLPGRRFDRRHQGGFRVPDALPERSQRGVSHEADQGNLDPHDGGA